MGGGSREVLVIRYALDAVVAVFELGALRTEGKQCREDQEVRGAHVSGFLNQKKSFFISFNAV
jgi:hypothetical protein